MLVDSVNQEQAAKLAGIAAQEAWRIERKYSRYLDGNIVARINSAKGAAVKVDEETADLIDFAATLFEISDAKFDITSGVLREAWTFDGTQQVPDQALIDRILPRVGWQKVDWQRPVLTLLPDMQIDLGGFGKEYAVDRTAALLSRANGLPCLVNFGGDLFANDCPPGMDGWTVGIEAIDAGENRAERRIRLRHGALATSGDTRRFVLRNGTRYGHVLNPANGWPVSGAPRSITVAADTCMEAGMLATLAMLEGAGAEDFLAAQNRQVWIFR